MKTKLTRKESFFLGLTLFGLFFGAGNLIFPVHLGQLAGANIVPATIGFIVIGVTVPILAVAAIFSYRTDSKIIFQCTLTGTIFAAVLDFIKALPFGIDMSWANRFLPLFDVGFGWLAPSVVGLLVGSIVWLTRKKKL